MKAVKLLFVFSLLMLPFFMNAQGIVGTWKWDATGPDGSTMSASITFKADGSFALDLGLDGNLEGTGSYTVDGDNVTIKAKGAGCDDIPGTYKMVVNGNSIKPELVSDECEGRINGMPDVLTKVE